MRSISTLILAAVAGAQNLVTLPLPAPGPADQTPPFASGVGHFQQWFPATQTVNFATEPVRIDQLQILAGSTSTGIAHIDMQVEMAHGPAFAPSSTFASNLLAPSTVVFPRAIVTMTAAGPGQVVLTLPFSTAFQWDGTRAVTVDIKVFSNDLPSGTQFLLRGSGLAIGQTTRVYAGGNASAATGTVASGQGLFMVFRTRQGGQVAFGSGCPGRNSTTPIGTTTTLATPGQPWTHVLSSAAAQRFCALALGGSRTQWITGGNTIPLPLAFNGINGGFGCNLLVAPDLVFYATTVGSGSAGTASIFLAVPPLPTFVGLHVFTQWVIDDPAANNGIMSATAGLWSIITPVGG